MRLTYSEWRSEMRLFMKHFLALVVVFAALSAAPGSVRADARLDTYRANGIIAERFDGYVEIRGSNAPSEARAVVENVNAKRRALYNKRANESNVAVAEVGKVFANKIVDTAPPGTYFRQPSGGYVQK
jgi:uncharacterized protein YdbL (DUF1318 family)